MPAPPKRSLIFLIREIFFHATTRFIVNVPNHSTSSVYIIWPNLCGVLSLPPCRLLTNFGSCERIYYELINAVHSWREVALELESYCTFCNYQFVLCPWDRWHRVQHRLSISAQPVYVWVLCVFSWENRLNLLDLPCGSCDWALLHRRYLTCVLRVFGSWYESIEAGDNSQPCLKFWQ